MAGIFRVSDAAALALHALALLAKDSDQTISAKDLAAIMDVSLAHLAKVMQRLEHAGYVISKRGPSGGFVLNKKPTMISLKAIYESIEGPLKSTRCLLGRPFCMGDCLLSETMHRAENNVVQELDRTTLADFAKNIKLKPTKGKKAQSWQAKEK